MIEWLLSTAIAVSALIVLVLLLRGPVARHFGARAAYALWLAPLLRAVVPPFADWSGIGAAPGVTSGSALPEIVIVQVPAATAQSAMLPWLFAAWAAGAGLYLAVQLIRHHRFIGRALARGIRLAPRGVPYDVVASDAVEGPLATGLVHPLILVPIDFGERFTAEQQHLALLHEQLHHRRGDLWASAAALLVVAALWFNPFAHLALGAFRRDMEAACDSSVVASSNPAEAAAYAETILRSAVRPVPRSLCALTSLDELKGRLTMLTMNHGRGRKLLGGALAAGVSIAGLAVAVPAQGAPDPETRKVEKHIQVDHRAGGKDVLVRNHDGAHAIKCPGEKFEAGSKGGTAEEKNEIKFFLCVDHGESLLAALEKAEADVQKSDDMPAERKADILTQIRSKIAELRAKG